MFGFTRPPRALGSALANPENTSIMVCPEYSFVPKLFPRHTFTHARTYPFCVTSLAISPVTDVVTFRVQFPNVGRSAADNAKGVRKLLVKLRPREVGELGWVQKQQRSSPFYHETPRKADKRMRRAKEMLDRYWRIVNPFKGSRLAEESESYEGRVFAAAASFGASCRDTGIRSCPTSLGSSPIHRRMNSFICASRELSVRERDCSLQAAIAHCKKSFGVADGGK